MVTWNKTKIVATVGPASNSRRQLRNMLLAGVDVLRINGAHGSIKEHRKTIRLIRSVARRENFPAAILLDLPGPKIRIGRLKREPIFLMPGKIVTIDCSKKEQTDKAIPLPMRQVARAVRRSGRIFINDGIIELKVLRVRGSRLECAVISGGEIKSLKGVNLPHVKLNIGSLTKKDKNLLKIAIEECADYVGLSFVRSATNVLNLKRILKKRAPEIKIIAKIEKPEALNDIDAIIRASDAIMIARGDLGIEMPINKVPVIQKDILVKCHLAGKPAITATQMLESMVESASPTRAEVTDVANAVWEGSDAIMLSAETSIGKFPVAAVKMMVEVALEAEKRMPGLKFSPPIDDPHVFQAVAISDAASLLAKTLKAKVIVTPTRSGRTALFVSKHRPEALILAPTEHEKVARRMSLYWGVRPIIMKRFETVDKLLASAERLSLRSGLIRKGDTIVITSGAHGQKDDITRLVEIRRAGVKNLRRNDAVGRAPKSEPHFLRCKKPSFPIYSSTKIKPRRTP